MTVQARVGGWRPGRARTVSGQLARRALYLLAVLVAASMLTAGLIDLLPGNPAYSLLGQGATPAAVARIDSALHLNQSFLVRYVEWVGNLLRGDLGTSYLTGQPVASALAQRIPVSLEEIVLSQLIALAVSIPLGMRAAYRPGGATDRLVTVGVFFFLAMPIFVLAVLLSLVFAVRLGWFPATGYVPLTQNPLQNLRSLALPVVSLAAGAVAGYVRVLRAEMIATLQEDYIAFARAKGLPTAHILLRHALKPSGFTLLTIAGLNVAGLIGGAVVIEQIFSVPGVGSYLITSITQRDYLAVQGAVVVIAVAYVLVNFLVDAAYALLDPRARNARRS